ncbi:MAG TPA: hypothetical protein VGC65_11380 [Bacteroidia bacterium]|jgi:hypothetical protein
MKKYIIFLFLFLGSSIYSWAQSASHGKVEKIHSQKRLKKQMSHFSKPKMDKKLKHNGTLAWRTMKLKRSHPDGISITDKNTYKMAARSWKKKKNKNFGTYTME